MPGVFRGYASGNTFNVEDVVAVWDDINKFNNHPDGEPKKGKIYLYILVLVTILPFEVISFLLLFFLQINKLYI